MNTTRIRRPGGGPIRAPRPPETGLSDTLAKLEFAITQIQEHNASRLSFEQHYRYAYTLVTQRRGPDLYVMLHDKITIHLTRETQSKIVPVYPPCSIFASAIEPGNVSGFASANIAASDAGQLFLDRIKDLWEDHLACMSKLRDVLKYVDREYTQSTNLPSIYDLGLVIFLHSVILYTTTPPVPQLKPRSTIKPKIPVSYPTADSNSVIHRIVNTLLTLIRVEREGEVISRHSIKSVVLVLTKLIDQSQITLPAKFSEQRPVAYSSSNTGTKSKHTVVGPGSFGDSVYTTCFENQFLECTRVFYEAESERLLLECDGPGYLMKIDQRLNEEDERALAYLAPSTAPFLRSLLETTLITNHLPKIINHPSVGLDVLLREGRMSDLRRMYNLFGYVATGRVQLAQGTKEWIVSVGKKINEGIFEGKEAEGKKETEEGKVGMIGAKTRAALLWVQSVLALKDKLGNLLQEAFFSDAMFQKTVDGAFEDFVNQNSKAPEYISLFIDDNLKKGIKGKSEDEIDIVLDQSISLFRFLSSKDTFLHYYNMHLSKRLLNNKSVSDDAEKSIVAKLRVEAGTELTKRPEGMLNDVKISEEMTEGFRSQQSNAILPLPYDMSVIICGQNNWPSTGPSEARLPPILERGVQAFQKFYDSKHSGRKLTFRPDLGSVEVKARFAARSHELTVSTYGMMVLALFDKLGDEELSYGDILQATNIVPSELKRILQSLACAKFKVLVKNPKGRDVAETDSFSFNNGFTCNFAKVKIQMVVTRVESAEKRQETDVKLNEERMTLCEACCVRVMKDRKVAAVADLTNDVIAILSKHFAPSPQLVKTAIDRLIERDYLERDEIDRRKLRYLA